MSKTSEEKSNRSAVLPERGDKTTRLEAFVDAAFAFSVTLLVISGDHLPRSVDDLILALKAVPTFAASFMLILMFWTAHAEWSRRYGLDDARTRQLSLLLVFLVLIFVYPLRMFFASFFSMVTNGWLPAKFSIATWGDIPALFVTYGVANGALCLVMLLLYRHAWNSRVVLQLSFEERVASRMSQFRWAFQLFVATLSVLIALLTLRFGSEQTGWVLGLPGYLYFAIGLLWPLNTWYERRLHAQSSLA